MAKIQKFFGNDQNYIRLSVTLDNENDFSYEDVEAKSYENGKFKADITASLYQSGALIHLVDSVDWSNEIAERNEICY